MMKILFCCEFYAPSVGGVQEVMKQIAEHLVLRGHDVTVATRKLPSRDFNEFNGVKIAEFKISGNFTYGMTGELDNYREFVTSGQFDVMMIKAAQQCTFDALWPVLDRIPCPKVFIPCGFSGLYLTEFEDYFRKLPAVLRKFDHLIFYASDYRDINFARKHGIEHYSIIPNGASEVEFSVPEDPLFRKRHGIGEDDTLFLTVGSFTGAKGHLEVVSAFRKMKTDRPATLILNGNIPPFPAKADIGGEGQKSKRSTPERLLRLITKGNIIRFPYVVIKSYILKLIRKIYGFTEGTYESIAEEINNTRNNKKVIITDLPRQELVQAFMSADLFVFASNIEYSPLVLYEAAAAGAPFLSVPVGNAEEIARWTGSGQICKVQSNKNGTICVKPSLFAKHMSKLANNKELLQQMGENGRKNWAKRFTWEKITTEYENVFKSLLSERTVSK